MFDVDKIQADNPLPSVAERYIPDLKPDGKEFHAPCPFHDEKDPSFTIYQKRGEWRYHCFGCGATGDTIGFIMDIESIDFKAACEVLGGEREPARKATKRRKPVVVKDIYDGYEPLTIPEGERLEAGRHFKAWNPKRADDPKRKVANYKPSIVFPYRDSDGAIIGYVIRVDTVGGRKLTPTIRWVKRSDGETGWCHYGFDEPRPLYGSDRLNKRGQVLVVEGEKAADAGMRLMQMPCISWHGGTNAVDKADWAALKGRKVVIMGDADAPGEKAAQQIADILASIATEIKVVAWDKDKPKGWDIADAEKEGMTRDQVLAWMKSRTSKPNTKPAESEAPPVEAYHDAAEPEQPEHHEVPADEPSDDPEPTRKINGDAPFKILGYNNGHYYYFPEGTQQITRLTPSMHNRQYYLSLAPLEYWATAFPGKNEPDWLAVSNALMNRAGKVGVFSGHQLVRGRGAWLDNDEVIIHTGTSILANGSMHEPGEFDSKFVYQKDSQLSITKAKPSTNKEAHRLVQICNRLTWEMPLSGALLAGWCVIAPVCGILKWRPHIWITGQKGSGKTTVIRDVISRVIGEVGLYMDGDSTEAGIRQTLNRDARPIIFDEAESENKQDAARMQKVLSLARKASSGGTVVKGTTHGDPITYTVRSAFCFSSINTAVQHSADESRTSRLVLIQNRAPDREEHFNGIMRDIIEWFTPEYSARMFARTVANIDTLLANAETFIDAAALTLGDRRAADQIGPMLAGYYLCHKTDKITLERAIQEIENNNWDDHTAINSASDASYCLEMLTSHKMRVYVTDESKERTFTVGELIVHALGFMNSMSNDATEALRSIGILPDRNAQAFIVSKNSSPIDAIYTGSPWASGDARTRQLKTLKGATMSENKYYSSSVQKSRGVVLDVGLVEG